MKNKITKTSKTKKSETKKLKGKKTILKPIGNHHKKIKQLDLKTLRDALKLEEEFRFDECDKEYLDKKLKFVNRELEMKMEKKITATTSADLGFFMLEKS